MNKILNGIIITLKKNDNKWMTTNELFSKIDKTIFAPNKQGDTGKRAIIGARIHENKELFEIDGSQRPKRVRLKQMNGNPETIEETEQDEEEIQKFSFNFEQDLKRHIVANLDEIENGLNLYPNGIEFSTDIGRIDILATDKNNDFVIIELKAGTAGDKALGQIQGYMAWIKKNLAKDKNVRGIIISNDIENRLKYAATLLNNLEVKKYEVRFSFQSVNL
jgi:hypothetical protein